MKQQVITYGSSSIHFTVEGQGEKTMVCLHGYGESAKNFEFLQHNADNLSFTIIAIDLPFHGQTEWREKEPLYADDLNSIIESIIQVTSGSNHIPYMLTGFSLGGRLALSCYQSAPERIEKLVLIAPDGLKVNGWYWFATQTWAGNQLFALTMKKPYWFFGLLKLMKKLNLVNHSIFKFVNHYISDDSVRHSLYLRWTQLRKLKPDLSLIKKQICEHHTPVRLLYGKHDRIIVTSVGHKFRAGIESCCTLLEINCGHQVLHEKHSKEILNAIQQ